MKPTLDQVAADWTASHPVGTLVLRYLLLDPLREPMLTRIRSEAWVAGGHTIIVKVEGVAGGVLIGSLKVVDPDNARPALDELPVEELLCHLPPMLFIARNPNAPAHDRYRLYREISATFLEPGAPSVRELLAHHLAEAEKARLSWLRKEPA